MIGVIVTLAIIGAVLGLIFSRNGKEGQGALKGAKSGARLGCFIYLFLMLLLVILVIVLATSCNGIRPKIIDLGEEKTDTVQLHKIELEGKALALIDSLSDEYAALGESGLVFTGEDLSTILTDKEKLDRPDYLLDPSSTGSLLTIKQKITAFAILIPEMHIREMYGLPNQDADEAIKRLAVDLNIPFGQITDGGKAPVSDRIRNMISYYKDQGLLNYYWYMEEALVGETMFLISRKPDIFLRNVSDEGLLGLQERLSLCNRIIREYSNYDPVVADMLHTREELIPVENEREFADAGELRAYLMQFLTEGKDGYAKLRAHLLEGLTN